MERLAKNMRNLCGFLLVANIIVTLFVPITKRVQENYDTIRYTQLDYMRSMGNGALPKVADAGEIDIMPLQIMFIIFLMILPALIALSGGIYGIVGSSRQIFTSIASYVVFAMYIVLAVAIGVMWPESQNGEVYQRDIAYICHMFLAGAGTVTGIVALIVTPKKHVQPVMDIQGMHIFTDSKMAEPKYNIVQQPSDYDIEQTDAVTADTAVPEYVPGAARGVMVGLKGIYAGAEISFKNGETIKLGRLPDNDLIFHDQGRVSRNHCAIRWDADKKIYYFKDYSSNGSFVEGSDECLPQNIEIRLKPGTVVMIGSEANVFRLE